MANAATNDDEDYIRQYGDNPNAPDIAQKMTDFGPENAPAATFSPAAKVAVADSLERFNAASRAGAGVLPGVEQSGSTDVTDQTNLNVAAAMERADLAGRIIQPPAPSVASTAMDEFGQQRQQIEQQKTQLMAKLGMIPPSAAGLAAVVLPSSQRPRGGGLSDYGKAFEQLNYLNNESRVLHQQQHYSAIENTRQIHEDAARNTHIMVTNGIGKLLNAISEAQQKFPTDYDQQKLYVLHIAKDDPEIHAAGATQTGAKIIAPYSDLLHGAAATKQSIEDAITATESASGQKVTSVATTSKGVDVRTGQPKVTTTKPTTLQSDVTKDLANASVEPAEFANRTNIRTGKMEAGKFTNQYSGADQGDTVAFDVGGKTYHLPAANFERATKVIPQVGAATIPPPAQVDLKALATRAISDPNASAEHKAAARKILGQ